MDEDVKQLVIMRLKATPPDISYSIGSFGDFTRNQLIEEVRNETPAGNAAAQMELEYLRQLPLLAARLSP